MARSQHHAILLLVRAGLLALAAAACAAAESCDTTNLADQMYTFCRSGEYTGAACCEAARSAVEMSLAADPLCICRLEEEPAFLVTGLSLRAVVGFYVACGGRDTTAVHHLVADRCYAPPPQQQQRHTPVDGEDIYADQPTPQ